MASITIPLTEPNDYLAKLLGETADVSLAYTEDAITISKSPELVITRDQVAEAYGIEPSRAAWRLLTANTTGYVDATRDTITVYDERPALTTPTKLEGRALKLMEFCRARLHYATKTDYINDAIIFYSEHLMKQAGIEMEGE